MRLPSYPKVWNIGHPNTQKLFKGPVVVQEKVDGSQFSFGVREGQLLMRSKRQDIYPPAVPKMFEPTVATAVNLFDKGLLTEGWYYRGEAFSCLCIQCVI